VAILRIFVAPVCQAKFLLKQVWQSMSGYTFMMDVKHVRSSIRVDVLLRIVADFIIVNAALSASFLVVALAKGTHEAAPLQSFGIDALLLSVVCPLVFFWFGFYTKGRAYAGRYKVLVVTQASTLSFLIFDFLRNMIHFGPMLPLEIVVAWAIATATLVFARVWSLLWLNLARPETHSAHKHSGRPDQIKSVLLIGGAGYVGSALLPKLLDAGFRIRLLDAFIFGHEPIAAYEDHPNLEIVEADFRRLDKVVAAMNGMDAVIHLGAIVGDPACALNEELTIEVNVLATKMIAEVAKGHGIRRFIFASTCSVYGACDQTLDERSSLNPVSLYARSKVACEKVLLEMKEDHFSPVVLRFGTIYGLSGRTRFDLVVNLLTAKAVVDRVITVFGSDQWRPFLHVQDAAKAVFLSLNASSDALSPTIFNVGSDEQNYTLGEVGEIINRRVPRARLLLDDSNDDRRNYRVNFGRIRRELRFRPDWTLDQGIRQVLAAFENGAIDDYTEARYSNVKFISEELMSQNLHLHNGWVKSALQDTGEELISRSPA
jgi:nucleoside-diphosphate-sugar epimerase